MRKLALVFPALLAAAGLAQVADWPDPVANHVLPRQSTPLTHGPMLGRPAPRSMRVWLRTRQVSDFEVAYSPTLPLDESSPFVQGRTDPDRDNTAFVDLTGLEPNTRYYYGIRFGDYLADTRMEIDSPWPSFRTLPGQSSYADPLNNPDGLFNFAFSIGCGLRQRTPEAEDNFGIYANPPSFRTLFNNHAEELAFHIVNGDYTYEEALDGTLDGYRANYKLYLERGRNVSNLFRYVPTLFTYDDHEVNSNLDGAGEVGLGDGDYLRRDPALKVWDEYAAWANEPSPLRAPIRFGRARLDGDVLHDPDADFSTLGLDQLSTLHIGPRIRGSAQSKQQRGGDNVGVYRVAQVLDSKRLRVEPPFRTTGQAPYSIGTHHYYDKRVGNTHFFFLDTRGERSDFIADRAHDPDRFILGETQRSWLLDGVRNSDAEILFIVSSIPWTIYHSSYHVRPENGTGSKGDGFCGYVWEREQIVPVLDEIEKPVVVFTGDVHNSFVVQLTDNVWEMMVGPMNSSGHPVGTAGLPPLGGWFDSEGRAVKVKWLGGYPDNVPYPRLRNTYYAVVQVNNILQAAKPEGVGYQFVPFDEPQVVVRYYEGLTGKLAYAEGISAADAKADRTPKPKISRWPPR